MNQSQINLVRLAAACRGDKKQFKACCELAQKLAMPKKALKAQPSASAARLQNYIRKINPQDLQNAIAKFGATSVSNHLTCASILETAAQKFAAMAIGKAGSK